MIESRDRKKFITIFPPGKNVHLIKDVGMIPYMLYKEGYYDCTVAFYESEDNLPYLDTEVSGLKYERIKRFSKYQIINIAIFLFQNYRKYDVVMLLHTFLDKAPLLAFFKILSAGRLKVYGKLDTNAAILKKKYQQNPFKYFIGRIIYKHFDLISVETKILNEFLNRTSYMKTKLIPNGFIENESSEADKDNLIITVARIGEYEKDHETFLKAIALLNLRSWKIKFIGPIADSFQSKISEFYALNPSKKQSVIFTGAINDREILSKEYQKAKIFALTSVSEGFPLVFSEALGNGCYIVSTDVPAAFDITDNGKFGDIVPMRDYKCLASALQNIIDNNIILPDSKIIRNFAFENFSWRHIVRKIYNNLEDY